MLCPVDLAHRLFFLGLFPHIDVLRPFESVQEVVTQALVKVDDETGHDLFQKRVCAAVDWKGFDLRNPVSAGQIELT